MENYTSIAKLKIMYVSNKRGKSNHLNYELNNVFSK